MTALPCHGLDARTDARDRDWCARVAHAFSRAAPHYARRATAQHAMGKRLLERLPGHACAVLDLGCGPGDLTAELATRYGTDCMVSGLDLAPGMLAEARRRHPGAIRWICGDAADLPLPSASLDLVISNLAIQWCADLDAVLTEIHRVLRPGGRALINTLAPGTLDEVGQAWARPAALLEFRDAARHRRAAHGAGFRRVEVTARLERFHYPDLSAVMASIKGVGAQVARDGARLSRADVARAAQRFETLRTEDGLPVSYHLLTLDLER
ncbi:methyltransferase domain-containing protein [Chromohalobacter canadensis]|uniref:methyltransferase domain-containing protein n=1 Tax=Chromohalobacter canadensis TaxID=141389 RepID=UPI0021BE45FA|nr:methyltransferase domain-containing protein [Chromohalobacter canadensis]MCT8467619.1 methyltransferase domain-containing protein [Chromohalobacter canadensis]MCT8470633.1 methyltransferase domain-containing protein [Chromohalobacter canadensis]MCT8498116.1 methyltransferase domain-containing protein [Chromohalobacter canadensis]